MSDDSGPVAVPGVVDGSLTVSLRADQELSFHVALGSGGGVVGAGVRFEFILRPEHVEVLRAVLDGARAPGATGARTAPVPCWIGIHAHR